MPSPLRSERCVTTAAGNTVGSYRIVRVLGEGGMGTVYLAEHRTLGRAAAIKMLLPSLSARPDIVQRFFNEARATTAIADPGIVQVFDFGQHDDGSAYIVMELLDGEPLDRRLGRIGRLEVEPTLRMLRQVATTLRAAHAQGIVHRDLKPENLFVVSDPAVVGGERAKILDFGIAKLLWDDPHASHTQAGSIMGTPSYMSPEQCRGGADVDERTDIYALGCVAFHLLTGQPPFVGIAVGDLLLKHMTEPPPVPSARVKGIPASVDACITRCLAKRADDRFSSMEELAICLDRILGTSLPPLPPWQTNDLPRTTNAHTTLGSASAETVSPPRTSRRGALGIFALLGVSGLAFAVWVAPWSKPEVEAPRGPASVADFAAMPPAPALDAAPSDARVDAAPVDAPVPATPGDAPNPPAPHKRGSRVPAPTPARTPVPVKSCDDAIPVDRC